MMVEETDRRAMLQRVFIAKEPTVVLEGCWVRFPAPLADAQIESGHLILLREQPSAMDDGRVIEALGALAAWQDRCDAVYPAWFVTCEEDTGPGWFAEGLSDEEARRWAAAVRGYCLRIDCDPAVGQVGDARQYSTDDGMQVLSHPRTGKLGVAVPDPLGKRVVDPNAVEGAAARFTASDTGTPGGQPSWSPAEVAQWVQSGGVVQDAQTFAALGWTADEAITGLRIAGSAESLMSRLGGASAEMCRDLGDSVTGLAAAHIPAPPPGTVLVVKRVRAGQPEQRWYVTGNPGAWTLYEFVAVPGPFSTFTTKVGQTPGEALARSRPDALALDRSGTHLTAWTMGGPGWQAALARTIGRLKPNQELVGYQLESAPDEVDHDDSWAWGLDVPADQEVRQVPVAAEINGQNVVAIGAVWGTPLPRPVHALVNTNTPSSLVPLRVLVDYSWFSESGGAPISWEGRWSLLQVADGLAQAIAAGDEGDSAELIPYRDTVAALTTLIAEWIPEHVLVPAALALQEFDPHQTLEPEEAERWHRRMSELYEYVSFYTELTTVEVEKLTARLERKEITYRRVARALQQPNRPGGEQLANAIDTVLETGVLGYLLSLELP